MSENLVGQKTVEVPEQVFEEFLARLGGTKNISPELISRLKKLILETKNVNEKALRGVLLPEE